MFETLRQSLKTGVVTTEYPSSPPEVSSRARGRPEIDWANWKDARPAAAVCPTGAIECHDESAPGVTRSVTFDLGKCVFCGLCADADSAIRMTNQCELATASSRSLRHTAHYRLNDDSTHHRLLEGPFHPGSSRGDGSIFSASTINAQPSTL